MLYIWLLWSVWTVTLTVVPLAPTRSNRNKPVCVALSEIALFHIRHFTNLPVVDSLDLFWFKKSSCRVHCGEGQFWVYIGRPEQASKYSSLCVCVHVFVVVRERVCDSFGGTIYLQLGLWEMSKSNREGMGAWEDLHFASCAILFLIGLQASVCCAMGAENRFIS